ncbi:MAG: hypothetical protein EA379_00975, partial [Phycisphaerales bacterium]
RTFFATLLLSLAPMLVLLGIGAVTTGSITPLMVSLAIVVACVVAFVVLLLLWLVIAHGLLAVSGGTAMGIGGTYEAMCWSSGPVLLLAVPCFGLYLLPITVAWWMVCATLMIMRSQAVGAVRATLCVGAAPMLVLLGGVGAAVWGLANMNTFFAGTAFHSAAFNQRQAQHVLDGVIFHMRLTGPPDHPLRYVEDARFASDDLRLLDPGAWSPTHDIWLGTGSVDDFLRMGRERREEVVAGLLGADTHGGAAQRLGDMVFVTAGIDIDAADPGVWLLVVSIDPARRATASAGLRSRILVGDASGSVEEIEEGAWPERLWEQEELRASLGLPAIGDVRDLPFTPYGAATAP